LVKDDGIYLMSNGEPGLPETDTANKVVDAWGYEALPATTEIEERMARYDKIREATGGDDFAEFLPAGSFAKIMLTADHMSVSIVSPSV